MKNRHFGGALFAGASVLVLASVAHAQAPAAPAASAPAATTIEEVVITGSRTIKNGNAAPQPVTVVQAQDIEQTQPGVTLAEALNNLPVFSGSKGTASNPTVSGSQTGGNSASNNLNLRNLGVNRTLVLVDGYRVPPTTYNNAVDVDIIPQMLVQRVDVVTGGVSAVYGSDAVAGVVNYIIDKRFTGLKMEADAGVSQRGDDQHQDIGFAFGKSFGDGRSHFEMSYQYINEAGIASRSDRPGIYDVGVTGAGTAASPDVLQQNIRFSTLPTGGLITSGPGANLTFAQNGVLSPFVNGTATGTSGLQVGGGGGVYNSTLIAPERAHQVFARFDQDFSNDIHGYVQFSADLKRNEIYADSVKLSNVTMSAANPFLTPAQEAQLGGAAATFKFSELMGDFSRYHAISNADQYVITAGLDGKLGGDWKWGLNYAHGISDLRSVLPNDENTQNLAAALDAVVSPTTGQIVCRASLTSTAYSNCVPLNPFGPTAANTAALQYVQQSVFYQANTGMDDVTGHVDGAPFSTWAGPVNMAFTGEWRRTTFSESTNANSNAFDNCAGLATNCTATTGLYVISFPAESQVSNSVAEGAVEANVPLVKDAPFIEGLSLDMAARYTAYSTSGDYWTWKIGGDWKINDMVRLRATRSRDIRAPTLYELFSPPPITPVTVTDLLTKQTAAAISPDLSNRNLTAELADTTTAGLVFNPLPRLSFSVDAYRITINNAITDVSGSTAAYQQMCYASGGASIWCSLQSRPLGNYTNTSAANTATIWYNEELNLSKIDTYGADFEANYSATLAGHPGAIRMLAAYQPHAYYEATGAATIDQGGAAFGPTGYSAGAVWRITGFAHFMFTDKLAFDLMERWRNNMKMGGDPTVVWANNNIPAFGTTNVTLTYAFQSVAGQTQAYVNISNLFDAQAPAGAYSGNGARSGLRDGFVPGDDVVGRAFTVGFKVKM